MKVLNDVSGPQLGVVSSSQNVEQCVEAILVVTTRGVEVRGHLAGEARDAAEPPAVPGGETAVYSLSK